MDEDGYFGESIAAVYDDEFALETFDPAIVNPAVEFIAGLPGVESALEFGIGTGRLALPLAQRGVKVHGIELSKAMVARLRAKPEAEAVGVTIGDFASTMVEGLFDVVYLVRNTIMNLTTQEAQVACFRNAATHLRPGGWFVIEVLVPSLQRLPPGETVQPFRFSESRVGFDEYRLAEQGVTSHHFRLVDGRWEEFSAPFRFVWPSELDLMSQIAGMKLRERWEDWDRAPFIDDSKTHVSVWEKPQD